MATRGGQFEIHYRLRYSRAIQRQLAVASRRQNETRRNETGIDQNEPDQRVDLGEAIWRAVGERRESKRNWNTDQPTRWATSGLCCDCLRCCDC